MESKGRWAGRRSEERARGIVYVSVPPHVVTWLRAERSREGGTLGQLLELAAEESRRLPPPGDGPLGDKCQVPVHEEHLQRVRTWLRAQREAGRPLYQSGEGWASRIENGAPVWDRPRRRTKRPASPGKGET